MAYPAIADSTSTSPKWVLEQRSGLEIMWAKGDEMAEEREALLLEIAHRKIARHVLEIRSTLRLFKDSCRSRSAGLERLSNPRTLASANLARGSCYNESEATILR
jgi:hypothetical protein